MEALRWKTKLLIVLGILCFSAGIGSLFLFLPLAGILGVGAVALAIIGISAWIALQRVGSSVQDSSDERIDWPTFVLFFSLCAVRWEPAPFDLLIIPYLIYLSQKANSVQRIRIGSAALVGLSIFLVVTQFVTISRSPEPLVSVRYWAITVLMIIVAVSGYMVSQDFIVWRSALRGYVWGAVVATIINLLGYWHVLPIAELVPVYGGVRLQGLFKDPNVYAPYLLFPLLILLASLLSSNWTIRFRPKWLVGASALLLGTAIFFAYSRGAWIGTGVAIVVYGMLRVMRSPRLLPRQLLLIAGLGIVMWSAWGMLPEEQRLFFEQRVHLQEYDAIRFETQRAGWDRAGETPLLGHGPLTTTLELGLGTHNVFLQMLYEHGVLGLASFVGFFGIAVGTAVSYALFAKEEFVVHWAAIVAAVIAGTLVTSLGVDSTHWRHVWLLAGFGWALPIFHRVMASRMATEDAAPQRNLRNVFDSRQFVKWIRPGE